MLCTSASPPIRACAFTIPVFDAAQPNLSFMNSIDLFNTFCRLCMNSSDWWAKEKECRDSDGKRVRSSPKSGDEGPDIAVVIRRSEGILKVIELDRGPTEWSREIASDAGMIGVRGCCCRILLRPDAPRPCSCSVMTGDLCDECCQIQHRQKTYGERQKAVTGERSGVEIQVTDLDIVS